MRETAAPAETNLFGAMVRKVQEPEGFSLKLGIPSLPPLPQNYKNDVFESAPNMDTFTSFIV